MDNKKFLKTEIRWILLLVILILTTIIFDYIVCTRVVNKFKYYEIERLDLFGKDEKNLKDFVLQENGGIVSKTDDPWIEYPLEEALYVKTIDVIMESVNPERKYAQVYLILEDGSWVYVNFFIHSGVNKICFDDINKIYKSCIIRFDLFSEAECSAIIEKIVINSPHSLTFEYHLYAVGVIVCILFFVLFIKKARGNHFAGFPHITTGLIVFSANMFLLCVYAPLDLYFNNKSEFWFDIYTLLPTILVITLIGLLIGGITLLMFFMLHERLYQMGVLVLFIALISTYIQGNFLVSNLPPLDGSSIDWSAYSGERVKSVVLWVLVTLAVVVLLYYIHAVKMYRVMEYVSGGLTGMLLITLCIEGIMTNGLQNKLEADVTVKNQFEVSESENFFILVLDAVDAEAFSRVFENHQEYKENFSDFTFYPDTLGAYSFTSRSIPFILSGEWFENQILFEKYHEDVYKNSNFLLELEQKGYKLGMYETSIPITDKSIYRFDNVIEGNYKITSYLDFAKSIMMLTGFKYAPFDIKCFCVLYPSEFDSLRNRDEELSGQRFWGDNLQFYKNIQSQPITYVNQKSFKFIHIEGAHVPYRYDKDVNIILEGGTYEQNIEASMTIVAAYLEKLKEADSYDNSVIIIMSDHGYDEEGTEEYGRQNPLLMIKGRNEHHDMQISQAPISYDDLQSAYMRLLDGAKGDEVFDWKEGDKRDRRFLFYWYLDEDHMTEYIQTGEASDLTTMVPTGVEFKR